MAARSYSIINPDDVLPRYVIAVKDAVDSTGGSRWLNSEARVGMSFDVSAPKNHFELERSAPHTALFAGGIGITPLWSMIQSLEKSGRSWSLHYGARSKSELLFCQELLRHGDQVRFVTDDEESPRHINFQSCIAASPAGTHFYCCGPKPMMEAFLVATAELPTEQIHVEYFSPKEEASLKGGFSVRLARSNVEVHVAPGTSILDNLRDKGIDVPHACGQGICGTCEMRVIQGTPDHRDSVLTQPERDSNQTMMICCSGSKTNQLVLDY
ncbi:PDR/VanB family oxidoreductase [Ottowia thiooxydans]